MNQRFIFFLFFALSIGAFQCKSQTTFKVYFTYEKCAKESAFSFWFHDGKKRVPAHVTKLKDEYVVAIKLKTKYTYLQIDERVDNNFRSYCRFVINQIPAKIHYIQCDTNNSSSNWKDIKLENTEFLDIYGPSLYRFCVKELEADGEIRRQLINANSKAEATKLIKDLHAAEQKLFDKRLDFFSTQSSSYASLFLLRDLIEQQEGIETNKCQGVLGGFPSEIQNSPEGKLLLRTIKAKRLRYTNKPEIGKVAPNFETKDINGKMVKLENLNGKYVLLVFWATWCIPCVKEIPQIIDIRKKYTSEKLEVISISLDEDKQKHKAFVKHKKMDWTHIVGPKTIIQDYFINGIPETLLIDPMGKVIYMNLGNDIGVNTRQPSFIMLVLVAQLALTLGRTSVEFIRSWLLMYISSRLNLSLLSDFLLKLTKLPMSFFDRGGGPCQTIWRHYATYFRPSPHRTIFDQPNALNGFCDVQSQRLLDLYDKIFPRIS